MGLRFKKNTIEKTSSNKVTSIFSPKGCLGCFGVLLLISVALALYSLAWIPAVLALIFLVINKTLPNKKRNIAICAAIMITSFILMLSIDTSNSLESVKIGWHGSEYDIKDKIELTIETTPSDAEIESIALSENDIAELDYKDGKATLSFKETGKATVHLIIDGTIKSEEKKITVIDKEAIAKEEAEKKAEEEAKKKAEEEAKKKAEEEAKRKAEEEAAAKAEADRLAAEQAAQQQAQQNSQQQTNQNAQSSNNTSSETSDPIVYITNTGEKYHRSGCRHLKSKIEIRLSEARNNYEPCGVCHPPQ